MYSSMFRYISGGPNYVQMYYNLQPPSACMTTYNMSSIRTPLLRDNTASTCVDLFPALKHDQLQVKVLPHQTYLSQSMFTLQVWGTGLSCSPVDGTRVSLHSSCRGGEDHANIVPCVMMKGHGTNDLTMCYARCQTPGSWDYAVINIKRRADGKRQTLCEIRFKN